MKIVDAYNLQFEGLSLHHSEVDFIQFWFEVSWFLALQLFYHWSVVQGTQLTDSQLMSTDKRIEVGYTITIPDFENQGS